MRKLRVPKIDLTGQRFGKLTVLDYAGDLKWNCVCDCGKTTTVKGKYLRNGDTKSCGCLQKASADAHVDDLTGRRFGSLTVIERAGHLHGRVSWLCQCDCGNTTVVTGRHLKSRHVVRCPECHDGGMSRKYHLEGMRFGRLCVTEYAGKVDGHRGMWKCLCDCGATALYSSQALLSGGALSCGCYRKEKHLVHGQSKTRLYRVWKGMRNRCNNPNSPAYSLYGGRGIKVCDEWDDFKPFMEWAFASGYDPMLPANECTIDRIDPDGDYRPDNCRWTDCHTQSKNRRPYQYKKSCRRVVLVDDRGRLIESFRNSVAASKATGCSYTQVRNVLKGKISSIKGMKFKYEDEVAEVSQGQEETAHE